MSRATVYRIVACAALDEIPTAEPNEFVVTRASQKRVVAATADKAVIACCANQMLRQGQLRWSVDIEDVRIGEIGG